MIDRLFQVSLYQYLSLLSPAVSASDTKESCIKLQLRFKTYTAVVCVLSFIVFNAALDFVENFRTPIR